jgi:hypothetical protein
MNAAWHLVLKSTYRKYPIFSFALTIGVIDAGMGLLSDRGSLIAFGLSSAGVALLWRWLQSRQQAAQLPEKTPIYYLPGASSRPQLPPLELSQKQPPSY